MRYLVHVIDRASQHIKNANEGFSIREGNGGGRACDVLVSDAFYTIEGKEPVDAVTNIASIIKTLDEDDSPITLGEAILKTKKSLGVSDFSSTGADVLLSNEPYETSVVAYGTHFKSSFQTEKKKENESWIELHKIDFYVTEDNKVMEVAL